MHLLASLWDQLSLLLVLSPAMGFLVTGLAAWIKPDLVRRLAVSNVICTLLVAGSAFWKFELELAAETAARHPSLDDISEYGSLEGAQAMVHRRADKLRAQRLAHKLFAVDGLNLWPTIVLAVMTGFVVFRAAGSVNDPNCFVPTVLFFEAASSGALTANDLQVYLLSYGAAVLAMSVMLGFWGGLERRVIAGRFLVTQFCGSSFLMLGFAMLVMAVPWMKMEDSPTRPAVTENITTIIDEIQKWTTNNELAYQYENEVFPWMLLILSLGFAIQFGLFPFQSAQIAVLGDAKHRLVALYVAGLLAASSSGWLRLVMPLAPDLIVGFGWLMLVPSLAGAVWCSLRALTPGEPRRRAAFIFSSLSAVSFMGCCAFTRFGMSGAWLMQRQLTATFCLVLLSIQSPRSENPMGFSSTRLPQSDFSIQSWIFVIGLACLGLFSSGFIIVSELFHDYLSQVSSEKSEVGGFLMVYDLFRDSLMLLIGIVIVGTLVCATVYSLLIRHVSERAGSVSSESKNSCGPLAIVVVIAIVTNLFPGLMLHQCEPEFARVFRPFERAQPASSAEPVTNERQTPP